MNRIASVAVGTGIALACITGTPAMAYFGKCTQTWQDTAFHWRVRYECKGSPFDSHASRPLKQHKGYYPAVIRGKAGPRQHFRLRVTAPGVHGVWHFAGRIGRRKVTNGNLTVVGGGSYRLNWYSVSSGMRLDGEMLNCTVSGKPYVTGWTKAIPRKSWTDPRTWPACQATTVLMFDLVLEPYIFRHQD